MSYIDYDEIMEDNSFDYKESSSLDDKVLYYKKEFGLHKRFEVKYESDGHLYDINVVNNDHNEIIKCEILNTSKEKKVKIFVDIPKGLVREYNFKETILIYTDYDIREFSFYVQCIDGDSDKNSVKRLKEILYFNKSEENLLKIVNGMKRVDDILDITKNAPSILNKKLSIDTYIKIIKRCRSLCEDSIKLSIFCEELLKDRCILLNDIIEPIKYMYKKGLVTKNTRDVLRYLKIGSSSDRELNLALMNVKIKLRVIDEEFIKQLINLYYRSTNKGDLDKVLSIVLYSDNIKYNDEFLKIVFDFYKRNNDVRSLITLCRELKSRDISLKDYGIKIKDRNLLVKAYKKNILIDWKELLEYSEDYYKRSVYIKDALIEILEEVIINGKDKDKKYICINHKNAIRDLGKFSKLVYEYYIENILDCYTKENLDKIRILENYLNNVGEGIKDDRKLEIIKKITNFYIKSENEKKYMYYLKYYIINFSLDDNNKWIKEIIEDNISNIEFLKGFLIKDEIKEICKNDDILELIEDGMMKFKEYDSLILILKQYKKQERYKKCIPILKEIIKNSSYINRYTYIKVIIPIYNELESRKQSDMYELLKKRSDLPIEFREKNFSIYKDEESKDHLIKDFLNAKTNSSVSKLLALEKYFYSDDEFLKLIPEGDNSPEVLEIVLKKIEDKFYKNKDYVKKIIKSLGTKNKEIKKVEVYINDYYKYKDDINLIYIFGNMRVIKRKVSSICDFVILKGIFNKEETKGYLFKDEGTKNIIKKYLKEGNIGFREIDSKIIIINNEIENTKNSYDKVKFEIKNIIKLIKLQQGLILNGSMIIDFRSNSFKYINGVILPRDLENLVPYKSEYLCRNKDIFDDYKMITNPKGEITINEKNIVSFIKHYLDLRLNLLDKEKLDEENIRTLDSIYSEVIKNKTINSYGALRICLENIAKESDEEFNVCKYHKYLEDYPKLKQLFKDRVLELILKRGDITKKAKEIVINYNLDVDKKEEYFSYLLDCFNNHYFDLNMFELQEIYEKIILMIKRDKNITRDFQNELIEMFLGAPKKCNYDSLEVLLEAKSLDGIENIRYIEEKMIS